MLIEINCESDFVARTEDFQELLKDISMHIAATDPRYIRREDVTDEDLEREKQMQREPVLRAARNGKADSRSEQMQPATISEMGR